MNVNRTLASAVFGILAGIVFIIIGVRALRSPASHTFWNVVIIIFGILGIGINIYNAVDTYKRK